ncbi:MAG: hydantoinase/oxoprolinase family protein [Crocinitomicaceae bacterium]|nr:hydantoinase/oxoprolinase family protein [Crocinitomicaceae bacterium]MBK8925500.1 hydantoinase/oxoprolinase family protein [Crocinitomicaceae bacterium]
MKFKVGIDIGGTFTDLIAISETGDTTVHKTLSTPLDPSVGFINGLREIAEMRKTNFADFIASIDTIVHGTTVATNALLTLRGAKTALVTTKGFRDALEMRRGIREEQFNNHFKNVSPLVPRYLRYSIDERVDAEGNVLKKIKETELQSLVKKIKAEKIESVAICFMNSYKNNAHEKKALSYLRKNLKGVFVTASFEVLPSIRFYERVSTTAVSAFVGPIVEKYLNNLQQKLKDITYKGTLLIMQSNGGVVLPAQVKRNPAVTVLSGPAAAPTAGAFYSELLGYKNCITVDMGGTSFDAALVINNQCVTGTEGSIDRYRIALPSLDIITIGAGGGSIGWIDNGGLLRMGPQSAGSLPGPVCYDRGGELPACTDADLILGYLNPDFFAGGKLKLNRSKAVKAIQDKLASKLGLSVMETAAGMYRIINSNMAQGVRQVSVERGYDPREFLFIVAGGAGSIHSSEICKELEIPMFLVPNVSSIFCAAGMLLGDLKHDYIRSYMTTFNELDRKKFIALFNEMKAEGVHALVKEEGVPEKRISFHPVLDMRYMGQYHEVPLEVNWDDVMNFKTDKIFDAFHKEHNRQFGYSLKDEGTDMELINIRLRVIGQNEKPKFMSHRQKRVSAESAIKEYREVYIPELEKMKNVPVYDGDMPIYGSTLAGPCIIEKITTSVFVSENYDCLTDDFGSFIVYEREKFPEGFSKTEKKSKALN